MNLDELLHRWREGRLSEAELAELTRQLDTPEARAELRQDWFLETALPEALHASALAKSARSVVRASEPSWLQRFSDWRREQHTVWRWTLAGGAVAVCLALGIWLAAPGGTELPRLAGSLAAVRVERAGAPVTIAADLALQPGDLIQTGAEGGSAIHFAREGTTIALAPETTVILRSMGKERRFELVTGLVKAEVAPQRRGRMVWVTDTAEARVLGTVFALSSDGALTRLDVTKGAVEMVRRATPEATVVRAGECATADSQGLSAARPLTEADAEGQWNLTNRVSPGCLHTSFRSETVGAEVGLNIVLPPNYHASSQARFPVLYFLHNFSGDEHSEAARFAPLLREAMERGTLPPCIVVFPNCGPARAFRPAVMGRLFFQETPRFVDANFWTQANAAGRVMAGIGHGAQRALVIGAMHADTFGMACALDDPLRGGSPALLNLLRSQHARLTRFPPRLLLLHCERYPLNNADALRAVVEPLGAKLELRPIRAAAPASPAYPAAALAELQPVLAGLWNPPSAKAAHP